MAFFSMIHLWVSETNLKLATQTLTATNILQSPSLPIIHHYHFHMNLQE